MERFQLCCKYILTKQERECKLYDAFDKFTHIKGESLHTYYLRFTQLINDMNIYKMKMEQFQVNIKFLNSLPPEWSKFVTDVKLVKDLHTSNFDQLHAYLEQHEFHANEVRFAAPVFSPGDDPIACLNKAMAFLTAVASSRFPTTNNQLRTSSNPRNQATIQDDRVTVQQVQGRQGQNYSGTTYKGNATSSRGNTTSGQARVVKCYNCQGEGHMARQCTQPKRPRNVAWYKEKAMLAEAQEAGQILDEEQLTEDLDTYDSDCDDLSTALAVLMANIYNYGSDITLEVPNSETYLNDMDNQSVHALQDFKQSPVMDFTDNEISSDSNIIPYSQYLQETQQATVQDTNLQAQQDSMILSVIEQMSEQMINHVNNWEKANKEQNNESITAELERYKERTFNPTIEPSYSPPVIVDVPSELPKVSLVNASLKKLKFHLTQFDSVVKKRTTPSALEEDLLNEITEVQTVFDQMETSVQQFSIKKCLEFAKKEILLENDQLLQKIMSQDVLITVMNSMSLNNDSVNVNMQKCELCEKQYFEINDLKASLQDKDTTISKLKDTIKSLKKNTKEKNVHHDKCDLEPINEELENSVAKLLSENEQLWNEINQDLKAQIQDKVFVITSLKNDLRKSKGKEIVENVVHIPSATTIAPGMFKLDLVPLPPRLLQNREVHINYLRNTQEQANILREIVKQVKVKQPLDGDLDLACKYATRIQELLVYVQDTCPNAITPSTKKVVVTPMNNVKKVRLVEPLTSSSNIKQVESSNTSDSNTPVLSSTGVKCSTSICGSKPPGNKKNDRISQTPSRNKKNKVEAQPRKVNKMNRVVKPVCDVDVKQSLSNANSDILCATCNKSMFDGVHDKCLLDLVQNGNNRAKSAKKHKKQNIWKPTGHVFTEVGFKWKPTGRTFTIVGNSCPLTRFTSTNVVPPKQTTSHSDDIQKPELKVYSRKPKNVKNIGVQINNSGTGPLDIERIMGARDYTRNHYISGFTTLRDLVMLASFVMRTLKLHFEKTLALYRQRLRAGYGTVGYLILTSGKSKKPLIQPKAKTLPRETKSVAYGFVCPMAVLLLTEKNLRTDNGTEFVNQTLCEWYENVGITHQTSVACTPQQNGVVERQNRTLVEAARTMLIFSKAPLFLWAEAINTACYTQNRSLIRLRYNKTPYELMQDKKPDLSFFHVFGSLCYPTNDHEDLGKFNAKADIGIFVGYAPTKKAFRIYNRRTRIITETIHVTFDELTAMASEQFSSGPGLHYMTPATSSTGLGSNPVSQQPCLPPIRDDWDRLFQPMFDEYFNPPTIVVSPVPEAAAPRAEVLADSPVSTSIDQDAPSTSIPSSQEHEHSPIISQGFEESPIHDDPLNESP
ncbi:retrovirus-related pol polyprotein from transposon TNT 1-94 [Tanacetum coccineum]